MNRFSRGQTIHIFHICIHFADMGHFMQKPTQFITGKTFTGRMRQVIHLFQSLCRFLLKQLAVCRRGNSRYTEDTITRVTRRNGFQVAHACLLNHSRHRQARPLRRGKTITNSLSCTPQKTHEENLPCHSHPQKTSTSNTVLSKWNLHKPSCRAFVANTIWTPTTTVL